MKNFRGFLAQYKIATNNNDAYVKLTDLRNNVSVKLSLFNTSFDDASDIAEEFLNTKGINLEGRIQNSQNGYVLFTSNFESKIK